MDDPNNPVSPAQDPAPNPIPTSQPVAPVVPDPAVQIPSEPVPVTTPAPQPELVPATPNIVPPVLETPVSVPKSEIPQVPPQPEIPVVPVSEPVVSPVEQVAASVSPPTNTVESSVPFLNSSSNHFSLVGGLKGMLNNITWIIMITLAPITILVIFAQYAVPGDMFYPIKRSLENVVLAGASLNPTTRAFFHADLASRRFDEAEKLLIGHADVKGLSEFVEQIQETQAQIQTVTDPTQKKELEEKLQTSIADYETRLIAVQTQIEATTPAVSNEQSSTTDSQVTDTQSPTTAPSTQSNPTTVPAQSTSQQTTTQPTNTPTPAPTTKPGEPTTAPTSIPPTTIPTRIPTPIPPPANPGTPGGAVNVTIDYLACLRANPHNRSACSAPVLNTGSVTTESRPDPTRVPTVVPTSIPSTARPTEAQAATNSQSGDKEKEEKEKEKDRNDNN
jgi:hypothetical protein